MTTMLDAALDAARHGLSVIPISTNGDKRPLIAWKHHQETPATREQITEWWTRQPDAGLGLITGSVSGNLEMIELEGTAATSHNLDALATEAEQRDATSLWRTVTTGWVHASPSGGIHWHIRLTLDTDTTMPGNTRIARRRNTEGRWEVLAETRGEGGYTVIPPSHGPVHPTGKPWVLLAGTPDTIPTITLEERDLVHDIIRTILDQPDPEPAPARPVLSLSRRALAREDGAQTPGDAWEAATSWEDILTPHGWQIHHTTGSETFWTRPGKNTRDGASATTGHADDRDRLYVFTSSTDFEPETPYTKLGAYAVLEHGGDHSAAARALAAAGWGTPLPPRSTVFDITPAPVTRATPAAYGNLALTPQPDTSEPETPIGQVLARTLDHTDDWAALALVDQYGDTIRYVPDRGRWLHWNGHTWDIQAGNDGHLRELIKTIARNLPEEARDTTSFKKRLLSATGTTAALTQAQTDPRIAISWDDLDSHPYDLNTPGGIVNLQTGQLGPSDPSRLHTRTTRVTPNWDAPRDRWDQFLTTTFAGQDENLIPYLQRLLGYSATGAVTHHVLPFLHGAGANGKSTMLDVVMHLLGGYAGSTPAGFLMQGMQQHETEIARLSGLRFVVASEVNERDRFDEAKVKQLTGGDLLTARFMRQDHFTFTPTHHLWLMGNKQPRVQTGGESFWRRLRMIPFTNVIPKAERDEHLTQRLIDNEGPAILAWIIDGARDAHQNGLADPESVLAATREYASEEDALGQYIEERLHIGGAGREKVSTVRSDYEEWCHRSGEPPMSAQAFGRELRTRWGVKLIKSNGIRQYDGVMLYADPESDPAPDHWSDR